MHSLVYSLYVDINNLFSFHYAEGYDGLWHRKGHQSVREKCLSMLAKQYDGLPFGYSTLKIVLA